MLDKHQQNHINNSATQNGLLKTASPRFMWMIVLSAIFVTFFVWLLLVNCSSFYLTPRSDTWDYAQLGRNISQGNFFISNFTYPVMLSKNPNPPFYTFWRLPVYPLVCSVPFLLFDSPSIQYFIIMSGIFFALGTGIYVLFLRRFLGTKPILVAVLFFITSPQLISPSLEGLSESFYTILLLSACGLLFSDSVKTDVISGIMFGLAWLTRSNTLFLFPALVIWFMIGSGTLRHRILRLLLTFFCIGFIYIPWGWRNYVLTGNPFFNMSSKLLWMFTKQSQGWTLFRTVPGTEVGNLSLPLSLLAKKFLYNLWHFAIVQRILSCNPIIFIMAIVGGVLAWKERKCYPMFWRVTIFILVSDVMSITALSFIEPAIRLYVSMLPFVYLLAAKALDPSGTTFSYYHRYYPRFFIIFFVILGISIISYFVQFVVKLPHKQWAILSSKDIDVLRNKLPSDGIIISDLPDYLSWTLDRPTLFLPTMKSYPDLERLGSNITVLHLSPELADFIKGEGIDEAIWLKVPKEYSPPELGSLILETASRHCFYRMSGMK